MQSASVAPIKSSQVDDIDIEFQDSIHNATYYLHNQEIHSIWIRGRITDVNTVHQFFDIDDGFGRVLRIQYCKEYVDIQVKDPEIIKNFKSCKDRNRLLAHKIKRVGSTFLESEMSFEPLNQSTSYDDTVMKSFNVSVAFKDRFSATNGMDWDKTGEYMINSSYDKTVYIYSVSKSSVTNALQSKKHGVELVKFTNDSPRHIICSSESGSPNVAVRLWDIVENRYIKSFSLDTPLMRGVGILSHPNRNLMLTNAVNGTVSVYSIDSTTPLMTFQSQGESVGAFDFDGLVVGRYIGTSSKVLSLYDLNKLQSPFKTFELTHVLKKTEDVNSITFSPNGRYIILGTNYCRLICINSVNGSAIFACCYGEIPASKSKESELCFPAISPDGKYLLSGCSDNTLKIWNFKGQLVSTLRGHEGPPAFVAFNPRKAIISSACVNIAWWHPTQTA
ncbi:hypothetical protein MACK_003391 [Theileria orientalis]|uniref:Uncharacterized protein n=1 Tax=Theileria orientalis TaxID=68886 RepID=A0A976SIM0_THEOR|nr:hypothetical protein MACK_003391 [Theileria orientalis]